MSDPDANIEKMLKQYHPIGPAENLRRRVLATVSVQTTAKTSHTWPVCIFRAALAAMVLLALGLSHAAEQMNQTTAANVGIGPAPWTADAEQTARFIGGGPEGRQYIAWCLIASNGQSSQAETNRIGQGAMQW